MKEDNFEDTLLSELYDVESRRMTEDLYLQLKAEMPENYQLATNKLGLFRQQPVNYPDARKHQIISFIKSAIRIVGYFFIPFDLTVAAGVLIGSELVGILEELV